MRMVDLFLRKILNTLSDVPSASVLCNHRYTAY